MLNKSKRINTMNNEIESITCKYEYGQLNN